MSSGVAVMTDFGFNVSLVPQWRLHGTENEGRELWSVALPHQCDEWLITAGPDGYTGLEHEAAVREMRSFIAQAQDALACLERNLTLGEQP